MKKESKIVNLGNHHSITKEAYEKLANRFEGMLMHTNQYIHQIKVAYEEAFTKHMHASPHGEKLKEFQVHERRIRAKQDADNICDELFDELDTLREGVKKYGVNLEEDDNDSK